MVSNTGIGVGIGIPFNRRSSGGSSYISPDVLSSLRGVWIADQNTNNSTYRNIIKNKLSNRGGDFEILNAAYKLNSGYGLYNYDYTTFNITAGLSRVIDRVTVEYYAAKGSIGLYNINSTSYKGKIKLTGVTDAIALKEILYFQIYTDAKDNDEAVKIYKDGEYDIDIKGIGTNVTRVYFYAVRNGMESYTLTNPIYIEQVPEYKGAFVTDGVDDVIHSRGTVSELLGTKNLAISRVTVVSMMCQNTLYNDTSSANNSLPIEGINTLPVYNNVTQINKTGIYGYTYTPNSTPVVLNNIMGDKNDYNAVQGGSNSDVDRFEVTRNKFPVSVAWYWTFIADRVLTDFEIHQVIAYYNLDKYISPSIYYDIKRQGITNDNHSQFNDKLIDYSGNKRELQLYNIGWGEESGIGKYATDYTRYTPNNKTDLTVFNNKIQCYNNSGYGLAFLYLYNNNPICPDYIPSYKIKINIENTKSVSYYYVDINGERKNIILNTVKEYILPESYPTKLNETNYIGFTISDGGKVTIEQIGEYENQLVLDGVNDYGQYIGDLNLKDYTFIMNRSILKDKIAASCRLAKSGTESYSSTPFLFESYNTSGLLSNVYSYGSATGFNKEGTDGWSYLSTYNYNGTKAVRGAGTGEGNGLFIGSETALSNFTPAAISHVLLYPYSLNEFLIERQLKKFKVGTLYEDKVLFNPIINIIGDPYLVENTYYFDNSWSKWINPGEYINKGNDILISVRMEDLGSYVKNVVCGNKDVTIVKSSSTHPNTYDIRIKNIDKSPQRIDITIVEAVLFDEIEQDYPVLVSLKNREGKVYTWGNSIDVGEEVTYASSTNLLPDLYNVELNVLFNGKPIVGQYQKIKYSNYINAVKNKTYLVDDNEPVCILSPERLKLSNADYKRLGYIPDLSGNGNHGNLNNLSYSSTSGVTTDNAIQLDGVDDFITFSRIHEGGKQVFLKVNYQTVGILYDQRAVPNIYNFAIYTIINNYLAYRDRNTNGRTYIDGVLNKHIKNGELQNITHNIVEVAPYNLGETSNPVIGCSITLGNFVKLKLYTFMLFNNVSTDENIKKLNEIIGIEGKYVETPEYYYDVADINNLSDDHTVVKDRVSGVNNLTCYNFTFNNSFDSGYGGIQNIINFMPPPTNNSGWMTETNKRCLYTVLDNGVSANITKSINATAAWFWTQYGLPKGKRCWYQISGVDADHGVVFGSDLADVTYKVVVTSDGVYEINWNNLLHADGTIADPCILSNGWTGNCNIIIKQIPHYPNGLVFDGVDDFLDNYNLPVFDDYTVIAKRRNLDVKPNTCFAHKGEKATNNGAENAFIFEYNSSNGNTCQFSFGADNKVLANKDIVSSTPISYNDDIILRGSYGTDQSGMKVANWSSNRWKGIFYKLMLYSKTINNLSIHSLKNLFEKDEIIDLNNPIFKK